MQSIHAQANSPMALIEATHRILVATRKPPRLLALDAVSGKVVAAMECAVDADDLFYDAARKLVFVSCGEGVLDVFSEATPITIRKSLAFQPHPGRAHPSGWRN